MMYDPPHPGESILDLCIERLDMSITKAAEHLGVSRKHLSAVINARASVSPDLTIRLAKAFGGSPETWVRMQAAYDVWQAKQKADTIEVKPVRRATQLAARKRTEERMARGYDLGGEAFNRESAHKR